jgi:hypothetical protein
MALDRRCQVAQAASHPREVPAHHAFAPQYANPAFPNDSSEGWRLFFERLAAEEPVVLLVEDAQYADSGLLDFLDHLVDWTRDLPVYVLVLARPELGQARPGFGAGRNRTALTLDPLDVASMDQLVDALVPVMPAAPRAKITGQAQGQLASTQRAERDLARARLAAAYGGPDAGPAFAASISGLRELSTPYHLGHGLLDHADYLTRLGDAEAAAVAVGEARDIAGTLRCQPLLDRAATITPAVIAVQD